jgi:hypothetical protein
VRHLRAAGDLDEHLLGSPPSGLGNQREVALGRICVDISLLTRQIEPGEVTVVSPGRSPPSPSSRPALTPGLTADERAAGDPGETSGRDQGPRLAGSRTGAAGDTDSPTRHEGTAPWI